MLNILEYVKTNISTLLKRNASKIQTLYIDYEHPLVERIYFSYDKYRVYLHRISKCKPEDAFWHPHPWKSAVEIIKGKYQMGMGHSETKEKPKTVDGTFILSKGSPYEMLDPHGWHYVAPIDDYVYSIMVTGDIMIPKEEVPYSPPEMRSLTDEETISVLKGFGIKDATIEIVINANKVK